MLARGVDVTELEPLLPVFAPREFENATITSRLASQGVLGGLLRAKIDAGNITRFAVRECSIKIVDMGKEH